jgi:hypothetical protein
MSATSAASCTSPAIANGKVVIGTQDGTVSVFG